MDKDFHYYGTYAAARLAGYPPQEASVIAYAAQYVDDSIESSGRIMKPGENGLEFIPKATCHDPMDELGWNLLGPLPSFKIHDDDLHRVWMAFHFLPGNYEQGRQPDHVAMDARTQDFFRLLCLPRSRLAGQVVRDRIPPEDSRLHLIGIRMHAYADTGAHMYYAGVPSTYINDAKPEVRDITGGMDKRVNWIWGSEWLGYTTGSEVCTPPLLTNSVFYLGHGRMGHMPDYPWIRYSYQPVWSPKAMVKDNPEEYMRTFLEMVLALKYQRTDGGTFDYATIDRDITGLKEEIARYLPAIDEVLRAKPDTAGVTGYNQIVGRRCGLWKKELSPGGRLADLGVPADYDPDLWVREARKPGNRVQDTHYYRFNVAAVRHANFVRERLLADGVTTAVWPALSTEPVGRTAGQFSLHNGGGFVARMQFRYSDDDGDLILSKTTDDIVLGVTKRIDPGEYGVPDGSAITLKAVVVAGDDKFAGQELVYRKGNPIMAAYTITGTTLDNTLGFIGYKYG